MYTTKEREGTQDLGLTSNTNFFLNKDSPWHEWKDVQRLQGTQTVKYNPHT